MTPECDYLILGAGPAGLQLAHFLERSHRRYLVLEAGDAPGTFFRTMPRHRQLISINKVHTGHEDPELNLRWDWNSLLTLDPLPCFARFSHEYFPPADAMVDYLQSFADKQKLNVRCGVRVVRVGRQGEGFVAEDQHGDRQRCRWLVVATGLSTPFLPEIPGIQLAENYSDVSLDPDDFRGQRILIVGKGNSGFETANHLLSSAAVIHLASPESVEFAWDTHYVGDLRSVNNTFLDSYLLKAQNACLEVEIERIVPRDGGFEVSMVYQRARGSRATYRYDRIINCTGFRFDDSIFDEGCRPDLAIMDRYPAQSSCWESSNVAGLYFAGTLMQARDYKKTSSAFIHGFRYNVRALHRMLEQRNHGVPWPSVELDCWPGDAVAKIVERINRSSGLWLQFGFLGDVVAEPEGDEGARYYEDVPVAYVRAGGLGHLPRYQVITLEYGRSDFDPLRDERVAHTDVEHADQSTALHPILRRYRGNRLVGEHHVVENLEAIWCDEELHVAPLREFLERAARR